MKKITSKNIKYDLMKNNILISIQIKSHSISKRQIITTKNSTNNLYVEYLVVIDLGVYNFFVNLYGGNLPDSLVTDYINIYFTQLINGVNNYLYSYYLFKNLSIDESKVSSYVSH
jgi:hypothetical protein